MENDLLKEEMYELNSRLRIMILQNAREEEGYDENFLLELNRITGQILDLKRSLRMSRLERNKINFPASKVY